MTKTNSVILPISSAAEIMLKEITIPPGAYCPRIKPPSISPMRKIVKRLCVLIKLRSNSRNLSWVGKEIIF